MEIKAKNPFTLIQENRLPALVQAYFEFSHLKQLFRQGWLKRGVQRDRCESVAEHSLGVAVLALWLAEAYYPELDTGKVLQMALLHDFGEIYAGDIIPGDVNSLENKRELETNSVLQVLGKLPQGQSYIRLWEEYEAGSTPEARFVRQIDRLEMGFQAAVYQAQGLGPMDEFLESARQGLTDPGLIALLDQLEALGK